MGGCASFKALETLHSLKRRIGSVTTAAEAEIWWPLALAIDASVAGPCTVDGAGRKASRDLLWAVSDAIRALKHSGEPNVRRVYAAVAELERELAVT